ncbi:carboxylesterase family protein, partial [Embleya sp. NPDC005575]|uniref:carboxylesterase family protein n=1 Tax=Embleya sp. NPDC005575 TaxID=3156892 RepID=UPI0033A45738
MFATRYGAVRGHRRVPDVVAILGIPYAAPPFGADRFREPRAPASWTGIRDGARFGPIAPQSARLPGAPVWSPGDEDVLTVNIWTPVLAGARLPVLVWIHGGAHTFGSSAQPDFDGVALARAGLVVVTANHRLGFEGFGHVPGGAGAGHPDNRGLLDQVAALRWVRDNIAGFGGDPDNVTMAGQSSGATAAACLMVMNRARGLFRRVIAHSAAAPVYSRELAVATTAEVAAAAGCPADGEAYTVRGMGSHAECTYGCGLFVH